MEKSYQCIHFKIEELVPPEIFKKYGNSAWEFLDTRILLSIDAIREYVDKPCIINDWKWGGNKKYGGYRPPDCTVGAENSQHRHGRACDLHFKDVDINNLRLKIIEKNRMFPFVIAIEDDVRWLHVDCRNKINHVDKSIIVFKPGRKELL